MSCPTILIVGDGVVGATTAHVLARGGFAVAVIGRAQRRATSAAAGMLAPSFEAIHARAGGGFDAIARAALDEWDGFVATLGVEPRSVGYDRSGIVALDRVAELVPGRPIEPPPGFEADHAALVPGEGQVDPRALLEILEQGRAALGIRTISAGVTGLVEREGRVVGVRLDDGTDMPSDAVIYAGGAARDLQVPGLREIRPVRGRAFLVRMPMLSLDRVVRAENVYFCPKADGMLYVGATEEAVEGDDLPVRELWSAACARLPALCKANEKQVLDGDRPSCSGGPQIDRAGLAGLYHAVGHDRNGVLMAPWTAWQISRLLQADGLAPRSDGDGAGGRIAARNA
jgi:glycine oxidase